VSLLLSDIGPNSILPNPPSPFAPNIALVSRDAASQKPLGDAGARSFSGNLHQRPAREALKRFRDPMPPRDLPDGREVGLRRRRLAAVQPPITALFVLPAENSVNQAATEKPDNESA
jgi:hypothetical protein